MADTRWMRLRGLIGRPAPARGEGFLLPRTTSIHTCFMRYAIDVVFVDDGGRVLSVYPRVPPWRVRSHRGAAAVLELRAAEAERLGIERGKLAACRCSRS